MDNAPNGPASRWRAFAVVGPLMLGVVQVAGTIGASQHQPERRAVDALAIVLALAGPVALIFLRRHTVPVLWFVSAVTLLYLLRGYAYGPVILSAVVALFVAVVRGHRATAWLAAGSLYIGHFALRLSGQDNPRGTVQAEEASGRMGAACGRHRPQSDLQLSRSLRVVPGR